jgi:hypothetical protein
MVVPNSAALILEAECSSEMSVTASARLHGVTFQTMVFPRVTIVSNPDLKFKVFVFANFFGVWYCLGYLTTLF